MWGQLLSTDMALFKKVYRHTFLCALEKGSRGLPLETATVFWELLFSPPGRPWYADLECVIKSHEPTNKKQDYSFNQLV